MKFYVVDLCSITIDEEAFEHYFKENDATKERAFIYDYISDVEIDQVMFMEEVD
tara:strand:+ start:207 stop:368 length:162 start_codon:yes stop_codon:yes gene_type:complete